MPSSQSKPSQADLTRRAQALAGKGAQAAPGRPENTPAPDEGFQPVENPKLAPSGAFDHAGATPARERSNGR